MLNAVKFAEQILFYVATIVAVLTVLLVAASVSGIVSLAHLGEKLTPVIAGVLTMSMGTLLLRKSLVKLAKVKK